MSTSTLLWSVCRALWQGKSVTRAFLNERLCRETLAGKVIDVGGGANAAYIDFMPRAADVVFTTFDVKSGVVVDFETDALPALDDTYDTVLCLNVMEHIYNYQHLANEVVRITKPNATVIGFVPFLMWYHPDHRDFFRYTHEALEKIFVATGARKIHIEPVAFGPATAAAHLLLLSFPRFVRPVLFVPCFVFDLCFRRLRPQRCTAFALGYFLIIKK